MAVVLSAVNSSGRYQSGSKIKLTVQTKDDNDFLNGTVNVRLVYAEGVGEIAAVRDAMEAGIERWKDIWAPYGLTPVVTTETSDFDPNLPYPGEGSEDIYDLVMDSYEDELTMIVGETIRGRYGLPRRGGRHPWYTHRQHPECGRRELAGERRYRWCVPRHGHHHPRRDDGARGGPLHGALSPG